MASPEAAAPPPVDWAQQAATDRTEAEAAAPAEDAGGDGAEAVDGGAEAVDAEPLDPEAQLREQAGRYLELAQRTQADFDNYRKRMAREVRAAETRGIGKLARELLPALDNLQRALAAREASAGDHDMSEGIRLVSTEISTALGRSGIHDFDPTGEPFDPEEHEAVAQQPVEGTDAGVVVQVLQSGYRLDDVILRPARVIVAG
ncbi:MAG: nucleotide exchange factor GrpE [Solirubrobacteraceae bacterium]